MRMFGRGAPILALLAIGCGGAPAVATSEATSLEALRVRVAAEPRDGSAQRRLGLRYLEVGMRGRALWHLERADRLRAIGSSRDVLAELYVESAAERLELGDGGGALADVDRAAALGAEPPAALTTKAIAAAALAEYRRGDRFGIRDGDALLSRLRKHSPDDARLWLVGSAEPSLVVLADTAAWLADGGAKRLAFEHYRDYVRRGGNGPAHLSRYLTLHRWWFGDRGPLPSAVVARSGTPCAAARTEITPSCGTWLDRFWHTPPGRTVARALEDRLVRTDHPDRVAALVGAAAHDWLSGARSHFAPAAVDAARARKRAMAVPLFARPTVWRLAGDDARSSDALERALEAHSGLGERERVVLIAELSWRGEVERIRALGEPVTESVRAAALSIAIRVAAASGRDPGGAAALSSLTPSARLTAALAVADSAAAANVAGTDLVAARVRQASAAAATVLVGSRWQTLRPAGQTPSPVPLASAALVVQLAAPADASPAVAAELSDIASTYASAPARADRLAEEFVHHPIVFGRRAVLIIELFLQLGDAGRARAWADRLLETSPEHSDYLMLAGETAAAAGLPSRADVLFVRGASRSGDSGAGNLRAARALAFAGHHVDALAALKRAIATTAPGEDLEILELLSATAAALGRKRQLESFRRELLSRFEQSRHADVRRAFPNAFGPPAAQPAAGSSRSRALAAARAPRDISWAARQIAAGDPDNDRIAADATMRAALLHTRTAWHHAAAALAAAGDDEAAERARQISASLPR